MGIDIVEAMVQADDLANKTMVGHNATRSYRMMMFTTTPNAQWAADRMVKNLSYPLAKIVFVANRNIFRYQVGDRFRYTSAQYGIQDMVFRIIHIQETNLLKEEIKVTAIEDIEYVSGASVYDTGNIPVGGGGNTGGSGAVAILDDLLFLESPYVLSGNSLELICLVGRFTGQETGYYLYMSTDGSSYTRIATLTTFVIHGTLTTDYDSDTYEIDDDIGFQVEIPDFASSLQSVTRSELFGPAHLTVLGDNEYNSEVITWQTITPVSGDIYEITGVYRNRYGTDRLFHPSGTEFWFIGGTLTPITSDEFTVGSTRYLKVVPYSASGAGTLSEAIAETITFDGVCREPYDPANFACNDILVNPVYTQHCVLTWSPRVRGDGAGLGNPDYVTEPPLTWEGLFEVKVYVNGVEVRDQIGIDAVTWTYTSTMNGTDNGSLADEITFYIRNYLTYNGVVYYSAWVPLTVTKE